jgi:cytochrome c5
MMRRYFATIVACALFAGVGCSKETSEAKEGAVRAKGAAHAPADAKPGSYEDWCGEHQLPESQCTLCHPDLIAAFKATGDWCQEHSLPESHCRKCNPDLQIARGPKNN